MQRSINMNLSTMSLCFLMLAPLWSDTTTPPEAASVHELTQRVAHWQIDTFDSHPKYRANPAGRKPRTKNYPDLVWQMGALYAGMVEWMKVTDDPKIKEFLLNIGKRNKWNLFKRPYFADDHAVGQFYLSLYEELKDPAMIKPTQKRFDWILANPKTGSLEASTYRNPKTDWMDRWGWCDALFMAPPVWARLAKITGEQKYLDFMDREYHATYDLLFDKEDQFFWRDSHFFVKREKNGRKLYWSRGNGWVFGGLALMIPDLPEDWEGRAFYLDLFKTMANAVKNCQREDGTWSMGLLGGVEGYPIIETSGTSFFVFGLAWGINQGLLDRATYEPVVFKAWKALEASVTPEGLLGHVQPVGAAPGDSYADKTEVYGIGAFLAAGSEVYRLVGGEVAQRNAASPKGEAPSIKKTAYARFVPERKDDLAWENDKVAFRMYGPALRNSKEDSGIDCWLKRVDYPIIDKWYRQNAEGKSYHKDHGEGYDPYHVGSSRGCGGLGLWIDGKMATSNTFVSYKIIQASGDACAFELVYEWKHGSDHYRETKAIRLKAGEHLFQSRSTFEKNGKPAANLPIAIGLTTHGGKAKTSHDLQEGWMACWEDFHGYGLGTGVAMDPKAIVEHKIIESKHKDEGHQLLITKTDQEGIVMYHAGFGWAKAGDITDMEKWQEVLRQY